MIRFALVSVIVCLWGCNSEPRDYPVRGTVSYQGKPVEEGEIVFSDATGTAPSAHGLIKAGHYELRATPGAKKVRITATKETGKILEGGMGVQIAERVDLIPAQYNSETTLTRTVVHDVNEGINFVLD
jgi:hypothetical protein